MSNTPNAPAFPFPAYTYPNGEINFGEGGITIQEYAAIQLRVPDSGTAWLDVMIRKSQRNELAAKALQGFLLDDNGDFSDRIWMAEKAYAFADAMLRAREAA